MRQLWLLGGADALEGEIDALEGEIDAMDTTVEDQALGGMGTEGNNEDVHKANDDLVDTCGNSSVGNPLVDVVGSPKRKVLWLMTPGDNWHLPHDDQGAHLFDSILQNYILSAMYFICIYSAYSLLFYMVCWLMLSCLVWCTDEEDWEG